MDVPILALRSLCGRSDIVALCASWAFRYCRSERLVDVPINMVIVPEMIGNVVGVYNGKQLINVEIKPGMIGHYLVEFSITYKPIRHGKPGMGGSFIPLK